MGDGLELEAFGFSTLNRMRIMLNQKQRFGQDSESIAVDFLKKQGYKILHTNYRTKVGEIDIIARDKDTLAFIEVKARHTDRYGEPKYAITPQKKRKISMAALWYLKTTRQFDQKARFDVVGILSQTPEPVIEVIKNAFELV
jgi:putative endonuclease